MTAIFNLGNGSGTITVADFVPVNKTTVANIFGPGFGPRRIRMLKPSYRLNLDGTFTVDYPFEFLPPPPESPGLAAYVDAVLGID